MSDGEKKPEIMEKNPLNEALAKSMGFGEADIKSVGFTDKLANFYKDMGGKYILGVLGLASSFTKTFTAKEPTMRDTYATQTL